jgi:uncharacterized membrane protein YraQ (UPF0718 family)
MTQNCCPLPDEQKHDHDGCRPADGRPDYFFRGGLGILAAALAVHLLGLGIPFVAPFAHAVYMLLRTMWWGIAFGIVAVGLMQRVPRAYFNVLLGRGDTVGGLFRAAFAGLLLDLCSHGVLMIGAKLYERGASLAQVTTFLISSPWNSFTLTLILISLVGLPWTAAFIAGSVVIAIATGYAFMLCERNGMLPSNPNGLEKMPDGFSILADAKARLKGFRPGPRFWWAVARDGYSDGKMVMRWLFFGTILAALIQAFVPASIMTGYFGPTLGGLFLTLIATTIVEVCSEGSTPIGAQLVTRAGAPGNGFAFLMAGVSTDYTEMLVIRQFTGSWKAALFMPLISVPQILLLGWIMNQFGG